MKEARLEIMRLNKKVQILERLRWNDLQVTSKLSQEIEELQRNCDVFRHNVHDSSNKIPILFHKESLYHNASEVTLPRQSPEAKEAKTKYEDQPSYARILSTKTSQRSGGILSKNNRIPRVSPAEDIVAFHAVLTQKINDPTSNHPVIYDHLITNTGGVHYSTSTGVFTCTQAGVHVFSWSVFVMGHHYIYTTLVRNNEIIGSAETGQDTSYSIAGSATAATYLAVGDEVWVRVAGHGVGSDILTNLSMFTGFRLR
ncbi:complement C1q-like protein 4 [Ylistrum balloti]|uniref:complement C1q-like protein 4 n=1 Tax=Ylistrum balloti TaxID=509963 RepID=UPI002905E5E2|nr:complement C1q-like protein 4 [Ylistrum balloti]